MKKTHLIEAIWMLTALIACPVQAESISAARQNELRSGDGKQWELPTKEANQGEKQAMKDSSSTANDPEKKDGDCQ